MEKYKLASNKKYIIFNYYLGVNKIFNHLWLFKVFKEQKIKNHQNKRYFSIRVFMQMTHQTIELKGVKRNSK